MTQYQVIDEGDPRKFFTMIPNSVDDMKLSVYAYRLYGHLKRVAGDSGLCWQGTQTLADACCMSVGAISNAKKELLEHGLIKISKQPGKHGEFPHHEINISNIWLKNNALYQILSTLSPGESTCSPHEQERSPGEQERSCGETKNNPIKNNSIKKTQSLTLQQKAVGVLAKVTGLDCHIQGNASRLAKRGKGLLDAGYTPEQIERIYSPDGWWYKNDWRGIKGQKPTPEQIEQTIKQAVDVIPYKSAMRQPVLIELPSGEVVEATT